MSFVLVSHGFRSLFDEFKVNGAELRGCNINYSDSRKGFGIFASSSTEASDGKYQFFSSTKLTCVSVHVENL